MSSESKPQMDGACYIELERLLEAAIREDLDELGDITTQVTVPAQEARAIVIAKSDGVVCGLNALRLTYARLDKRVVIYFLRGDGDKVSRGDKIVEIEGPAESLLTGERTALNFLQRLSGIATLTNKFVEQLAGTKTKLLDTRKTTPGWRHLEKYAVRCGGGCNHRFGLYDMFLIKENHLAAAGGIEIAVKRCREYVENLERNLLIEVETRNLQDVQEALNAGADRIMLDNMKLDQIKAAVELVNHRAQLEASGNVTLQYIAPIAATGVDFISTGAITHSAPAMDFSMLFDET